MPKNSKIEKIFVNEPLISKEAERNTADALASRWLSGSGPFVEKFEKTFAEYLGIRQAVAVANGTCALHLALLSLDVGAGDEVIVPAFAMGACFMAVLQTGAKPVFVDCELETYNIDPKKIAEKISPRTKAVMAVHTYGHAADMDDILQIAAERKIKVLEDAAESHGGRYKGRLTGTMGDVGAFSFYANKIITTGEGGMIVTNDEKIAAEARKLRDLYHSSDKRFIHEKLGYNYRLSNLQAALGLGELSRIDEYIAKKLAMAAAYDNGLSGVSGLILPKTKPDVKNVYWMYGIVVDQKKFGKSRDELRSALAEQGIETRDFFYPPEEQPVLKNVIGNEKFPNASFLGQNGLYLPSGLAITKDQIERVIKALRAIAGR
ncbi:DegT/DnrJ/EryC1/StrS family aminotransferase [Patescibacteria group bacterium]|nr:DegT/DnrJ/EryC1/StrS family aminotransferase [Patescibacteria group bacterium]